MFSIPLKYFGLIISTISLFAIVYDFGFNQSNEFELILQDFYNITLGIGIIAIVKRYFVDKFKVGIWVLSIDFISVLFFAAIIYAHIGIGVLNSSLGFLSKDGWQYFALLLVFVREASSMKLVLKRTLFNPAQLFILSFLFIIFIGAMLLKLPNATVGNLSLIDALFTSTSAVCVTGLIVVDTGTYFTLFGQSIILFLIQIGGLGIMTFASYFSFFFTGGSSYETQLMLKDISSTNTLGEVFNTLKRIILLTLMIEGLGAVLIFSSLSSGNFDSFFDQTFFSIFHSISAFCNAGFSNLENGLSESGFSFNYNLHLIIFGLFFIGGIGFPIVFNLYKYLKYLIKNRVIPMLLKQKRKNLITPWVINLNSRIVLFTSFTLIILGTLAILVFEYHNSLANHSLYGKIVTSLFTASTPRTAGFNTLDINSLQFSTIMLIFLLMWIGASPGSTGGGIKTSTFAIATLNFWSLARGKERLELFRREIAPISIRRAFAIISLSLVVIGVGVFSIAYFDNDKKLIDIAFECFSAYSTVGLSLGITDSLSNPSKFIIILIMLVGRVSMLSILIAIVNKEKRKNYRYSKEEILIN